MKKGRYNKTTESFIVIILMIIVLAAMVILINSGRIAYSRILENGENTQNVRTALSYINMQVRQNDREGAIDCKPGFLDGMDVLAIDHGGIEEGMVTYIFHDGKALMELYVMENREPDSGDAMKVVDIDDIDFDLSDSGDRLNVTVYCYKNGETREMQRLISLKAGAE